MLLLEALLRVSLHEKREVKKHAKEAPVLEVTITECEQMKGTSLFLHHG